MRSKIRAARFRAEACSRIRAFFAAREVLEVETPLLSQGASHDFHIDLFTVPVDSEKSPRLLQTSPEPHMKRLLARGYPDIFQICKAFRKGESGPRHNPEFTLIEWYRKGFNLQQMLNETLEICQLIVGQWPTVFTSYGEAFRKATGLNAFSETHENLTSHPIVAARGLTPGHFPVLADILNFLMSEVVEPTFDQQVLTAVNGFPAALASQALPDPDCPGASLRFEIFGGGMELGNGYQELVTSEEYRRRFEVENKKRRGAGKVVPPMDEHWFKDIGRELPACSGVAVGLDRLLQLALSQENLEAVIEFPWESA